ncbi:MAG: lmo0937 family membrane protein [Ignavibacteriaceae bacterium]
MKKLDGHLMLWAVTLILFLLWLVEIVFKISTGVFPHIILIIAMVLLIINLFRMAKSSSQ